MDSLHEVKESIKELHGKVDTLTELSIENKADLKHHILRTDLNEERIASLEKWLLGLLASILVAVIVHKL